MMATGRASAPGRRTPRVRTPHSWPATVETPSRASFLLDVAVVDDGSAAEPAPGAPAGADEPTDDELDARARTVLEGLSRLEDLLAERVPATLAADLLSPFGPDSERIAREEQDR